MSLLNNVLKVIKDSQLSADPRPSEPPPKDLRPFMISYDLDLTIEGLINVEMMSDLIDTLLLIWITELFHKEKRWKGCFGYLWKSMRDSISNTLTVHLSSDKVCTMAVTKISKKSFSEGSCFPSKSCLLQFNGSRSWELISVEGHIIVIVLKYNITAQPFSHEIRSQLRSTGFSLMRNPNKEDQDKIARLQDKRSKPGYNHEKKFPPDERGPLTQL